MGVVFTNNAETTLAAAITSTSATSISVTSSSTFPAIQAGEHFYATLDDGTNIEIVKVTGVSGTTWTVVRASDSTTARTFANGITVQLRATAALLTDIQENIAAKSANQTVYNATAASNATAYDVGVNPGVEANAMVFLDGVMQHHDTFSFSGSTLTFDAAPTNGTKIEVIVDNLINLQSSNLTTDTFTATSGQTAFTLSDAPAAENNLIVFIDGVFQDQGNYSISNHTLTLATGAVVGRTVTVYIINPVNIGTPSDGTVTGAKLSGNITMPGTLTVGAFDVAFDSPTFVVDNANSRVGLGTATPSVPVDIVGEVKISSHLNMPDNAIAKFGAGSDLQIYHDGNNSFIDETGTGNLYVKSNSIMHLMSDDIRLMNAANSETILKGVVNGAVTLYHDNSAKLATTSTGIDVTGTATMDGLDVNGTITSYGLNFDVSDGVEINALESIVFDIDSDNNQTGRVFQVKANNSTALMTITETGSVGIGETSPANLLHVKASDAGIAPHPSAQIVLERDGTNYLQFLTTAAGTSGLLFGDTNDIDVSKIYVDHNTTKMTFVSEASETMTLHGGNVGIGVSNPGSYDSRAEKLVVGETGDAGITIASGASSDCRLVFAVTNQTDLSNGSINYDQSADSMAFETVGSERMRIDSSGRLGIGTTSPATSSAGLHVVHDATEGTPSFPGGEVIIAQRNFNSSQGCHIGIIGGSASESGINFGDKDNSDAGIISYKHNGDYMTFTTNTSERMRIASNGRISMGTTTTNAGLTVANGDIRTTAAAIANDANSFSMSQESSGGTLCARGPNGSTRGTIQLSVNKDNGGDGIVGLFIANDGNPCVGKTSSDINTQGFHIISTGTYSGTVYSGITGSTAGSTYHVRDTTNNAWKFYVTHAGVINATSTSITGLSDERLKENIVDLEIGLSAVMSLKPRRFDWKEGEGSGAKNVAGFIAQEVETVLPDLIEDFMHDELDDAKSLRMGDMIPTLVKAIQELSAQVEILKTEIQELKDNG